MALEAPWAADRPTRDLAASALEALALSQAGPAPESGAGAGAGGGFLGAHLGALLAALRTRERGSGRAGAVVALSERGAGRGPGLPRHAALLSSAGGGGAGAVVGPGWLSTDHRPAAAALASLVRRAPQDAWRAPGVALGGNAGFRALSDALPLALALVGGADDGEAALGLSLLLRLEACASTTSLVFHAEVAFPCSTLPLFSVGANPLWRYRPGYTPSPSLAARAQGRL